MRTLIAIDPGQNGGIATYRYYKENDDIVYSCQGADAMPFTITDVVDYLRTVSKLTDKGRETNLYGATVYLEDVHTMPGQGIASSGKFMRGVGNLEAIAICLGYKLIYVRPQVWQKALGLLTKKGDTKTQHKNKIKAFAQQRYPNVKVTLATADALAILEYAKMQEKV
jgi:crossover junction endodeoxyribonuclease RuvC